MIPVDAIKRIRSVTIHYWPKFYINGFSFFDKVGALLWEIGESCPGFCKKETVLLAKNEVIVGVVAKLYPYDKSLYTDF
jgi:hypothetical protein